MGLISEKQAVEGAIAAFRKLHVEAEHTAGVRALDRGELNLNEMKCVRRKDGTWVCTLPHIHLPLLNLIYEFSYTVKDDSRRTEYSCKTVS
jgi:hypothetical protein